ncbi:hypothetical protein ACFIUV_02515 [Oenococcus oeni]|uniref:hypothetical protein n=1 Tax=Oenococcus oeni TaxID=1247 RepID=UPI000A90EE90|nr:hypothetical protein [Oenococcus oeni]
MMYSKLITAVFVVFYAVLVWAVFSMHNMLAMQMMAIGMFAEALISLIFLYRKDKK